jgi:hypothetical protein
LTIDFKENVIDIVNNWEGYPAQDPCASNPAINSGHVEVKCYINNFCPFYKIPKKEDGLVFNFSTVEDLWIHLSPMVARFLTTTEGLQGVHFVPKQIFRHNYIYKFDESIKVDSFSNFVSTEEIWKNFNKYYKEITFDYPASISIGADKTRYKAEQSWLITDSVFGALTCADTSVTECNIKAIWSYVDQSISDNMMSGSDVEYDYVNDPGTGTILPGTVPEAGVTVGTGYVDDYYNSFDHDDGKLKAGETERIRKYSAQMPIQTRVHDEDSIGVHWRLLKRTPLFKGEDFFIRFYKQSKSPVSNNESIKSNSFTYSNYFPLDVTQNGTVFLNGDKDDDNNIEIKINDAVRSPKLDKKGKEEVENGQIVDTGTYNFYNQSYYIIELGVSSKDNNYFIVIPQRGNPTFIHFSNLDGATGTFSHRLGEPFRGVGGQQLIDAEWFDIVVRNHLGRLAIQFKGPFAEIKPWIIERIDIDIKTDVVGRANKTDKLKKIIVPRGRMAIWGGNLKTGFLFGPLQYANDVTSIIFPPRKMNLSENEDWKIAFEEARPIELKKKEEYSRGTPLMLPMNGDDSRGRAVNHHLLFNSADVYIEKAIETSDTIPPFKNDKLFTQDAQFYKNYSDKKNNSYKLANFFYDYPLRDFPDFLGGSLPVKHVKTSNITVRKYKYGYDDVRRLQLFDIWIGMMAGDHVFTDQHWIDGTSPPIPSKALVDFEQNTLSDLSDSAWFLPDCKTPIIPNIRLVSPPGGKTRWDDGTTISRGTKMAPSSSRRPGMTNSDYFIDATDHVMSFSHSWSSADLTSMEHTGSITFYLNEDMNVENNVTEDLLSLVDKNFYIEVWAGYENVEEICNYTKIPGFYRMFTGICQGGRIGFEYGKNTMTCEIVDYTVIFKTMRFFNSPWFDGMKDVLVINEIMAMAGFRNQGKYDPGRLIQDMVDGVLAGDPNLYRAHFDGRVFKYELYALPAGYSRLDQPAFKFNDGSPFMDAITKVSQISSKIFYFDEFGIAHLEDFQDIIEEDFKGEVPLVPLYHFTTNPEVHGGQLVFDKVEKSFGVDSVHNHIKVVSNTPDMHPLILDNATFRSMENPDITGFLGYAKTFFQAESMFGSKDNLIQAVKKYSVMFKPKIMLSFDTYGLPLRATDIIALEGEIVRVKKVDHTFDPAANRWWMHVETERYQSIDVVALQNLIAIKDE